MVNVNMKKPLNKYDFTKYICNGFRYHQKSFSSRAIDVQYRTPHLQKA